MGPRPSIRKHRVAVGLLAITTIGTTLFGDSVSLSRPSARASRSTVPARSLTRFQSQFKMPKGPHHRRPPPRR